MDLGYLDIHGADAFEPVTDFVRSFIALSKISALALLKIKLLLDLLALQKSEDVSSVLPREVFDVVRLHLPRSPISDGKGRASVVCEKGIGNNDDNDDGCPHPGRLHDHISAP